MATAIGTYASPANVKVRVKIADATDDTFLTTLCNDVNAWIESAAGAGRVLAPIGSADYTFHGFDAVDHQRVLYVRNGIRAITTLQVAASTGGTLVNLPAVDWMLEPSPQRRTPGWPALRVRIKDLITGGVPYFFPGYENVKFVGATLGWAAMPDDIIEIAEFLVVKAYQARRTGQGEQAGPDGYSQPVGRGLPKSMRDTLDSYQPR